VSDCEACGYRPPLCIACRDRSYGWLRGPAGSRGMWWAEDVVRTLARQGRTFRPWPLFNERVRAVALRRVGDLTEDSELLGMLALACAEAAAERYAQLAGDEEERRRVISSIGPERRK
jgi:hypothetical protein